MRLASIIFKEQTLKLMAIWNMKKSWHCLTTYEEQNIERLACVCTMYCICIYYIHTLYVHVCIYICFIPLKGY